MTWLSDRALDRLSSLPDIPDLSATRYRLLGEIARGGMGVVYQAEDVELGREVALKVLGPDLARGDDAERLTREARILAGLEHPGIVPVHDVGVLPDGRVFYVMKLVRGVGLDGFARSTHSLADALRAFLRICDAVAFANARGVIHRDLKPENVMVGEFGEILVMDWGVAKLTEASATGDEPRMRAITRLHASGGTPTSDGVVVGTPGFMAPEQERGEVGAVDARTDVFALGAMLRQLAGTICAREGEPFPRPLAAICAKATSAEKRDRYDGAEDLAADVARFLDGLGVVAHRESIVERCWRIARKYRAAIAVICAYLVMRAVVFLIFRR